MDKSRIRLILKDAPVVVLFLLLTLVPWERYFGGRVSLGESLSLPSLAHPFGTDNLGRDLVTRIASALRGAVLPLWGAVFLGTFAGMLLGAFSIAARQIRALRPALTVGDIVFAIIASIPIGLVAFAWASLSERAGLGPVVLALLLLFMVRSYLQVQDHHRRDEQLAFWTAHAALGGSLLTRLWRYGIATSWRGSLLETLGFHLRAAVAIEASLSYLGFGIQEPQASFGNMLASHFDLYLKGQWQVLSIIVAALALTAAFPGSLLALCGRRPRKV